MIVVDDHLAIRVLSGWRDPDWDDDVPHVPWALYFRVLRALFDDTRTGQLSRQKSDALTKRAQDPPRDQLRVMNPIPHTATAAHFASEHKLSLAFAEMLAAAFEDDAIVCIAPKNRSANLTVACERLKIELRVIPMPNETEPTPEQAPA